MRKHPLSPYTPQNFTVKYETLISQIFLICESRENKKVVKISGFTVLD